MDRREFDFEKLEVYQTSLEFSDYVFKSTEDFDRKIQYSLGDQFRRASLSICNNIAEGSGKATPNAKFQMYGYALDSARECIPMLELSLRRDYIDVKKYEELRNQVISICNMLSKLMQSIYRTPYTVNRTPTKKALHINLKPGR